MEVHDSEKKMTVESSKAPQYLEVFCKTSSKIRRFAAGTEAGYAVHLINKKIGHGGSPAFYIEAVKDGEEPVNFGPNSVLVDYGEGWKLQTVLAEGFGEMKSVKSESFHLKSSRIYPEGKKSVGALRTTLNFQYIGKVLIAFFFMFLLGAIFTFFLEKLPDFLTFINSTM